MSWRWTWVNFIASLFFNRLRFLGDTGLFHLHTWLTHQQNASEDNYAAASFYVSALLSAAILSAFHLRPLRNGVLLPSMPAVAHVLHDGHVVPLVDPPPQSLTRKVTFISVQVRDNCDNFKHSQVSAGPESPPLLGTYCVFCWPL